MTIRQSKSGGIGGWDCSHTSDEERVARKDRPVVTILEQIADAILSMARCVQCLHLDAIADGEGFAVAGSLGDLVAVLAADDWDVVCPERLCIATCVVVVAGSG